MTAAATAQAEQQSYGFQAEVQQGETWGMNARFYDDNTGRIYSTGNQITFVPFTYHHNQWIDVEFDINFDLNEWKFFLYGTLMGTFSNPENSIASIDIYPAHDNSYFIDDFSYEYNPVSSVQSADVGRTTNIYPNPTNNKVTVDINLAESSDVAIEIVDYTGRSWYLKDFEDKNKIFSENIDTSILPVGSYLIKIKTNENFITRKISVVR